jgi:hypothetical protein
MALICNTAIIMITVSESENNLRRKGGWQRPRFPGSRSTGSNTRENTPLDLYLADAMLDM